VAAEMVAAVAAAVAVVVVVVNDINLRGLPLGFSGYVCVGFPSSSTYLMARQRFWSKLERTFSSRNVKRPANIKYTTYQLMNQHQLHTLFLVS
jgi:hypothetical protein